MRVCVKRQPAERIIVYFRIHLVYAYFLLSGTDSARHCLGIYVAYFMAKYLLSRSEGVRKRSRTT